jgi:hypothetical protein
LVCLWVDERLTAFLVFSASLSFPLRALARSLVTIGKVRRLKLAHSHSITQGVPWQLSASPVRKRPPSHTLPKCFTGTRFPFVLLVTLLLRPQIPQPKLVEPMDPLEATEACPAQKEEEAPRY